MTLQIFPVHDGPHLQLKDASFMSASYSSVQTPWLEHGFESQASKAMLQFLPVYVGGQLQM